MTNKEIFRQSTRLKGVEWKSPSCDAVFIVKEPNAGQAIELSKIAASGKGEADLMAEFVEYVWTRLVIDPETEKPFTRAEYQELLKVKDLMEMGEPSKITMEYIARLSTTPSDVMQKNSEPTT